MKRFGLFRVGNFGFAISVPQIQKILQNSRGYMLPRLPGVASTVLVESGQLIPLFDLEQMFGGEALRDESSQGYQVLVDSDYGTIALPADFSGQIVAEQKGEQLPVTVTEKTLGISGQFVYQSVEYHVLDINFLAIEMTQGCWQKQPDTGGARRHQ